MLRRLLTLLSAVSLLLCVAVCVLWVRSHGVMDRAWHEYARRSGVGIAIASGQVRVHRSWAIGYARPGPAPERWRHEATSPPPPGLVGGYWPGSVRWRVDAGRLGFHAWGGDNYGEAAGWVVVMPARAALLVASPPAVWWAWSAGRRRFGPPRAAPGRCPG